MPTAYREQTIVKTIFVAGLVAGTLDILAAFTNAYLTKKTEPETVLKYIAGGVFTVKKSMAGGWEMAAWGLLFHFIIAFCLAAFFVLLYINWKALSRFIVVAGLLYGIFAWAVTTRLIIPYISTLKSQPVVWEKAITPILILMFMLGLPIALITHKYLRRPVRT
jgi:hypothetical protein